MPTDVSDFKKVYRKAIESSFPPILTLGLGEGSGFRRIEFRATDLKLRYGTNPHQSFAAYVPINDPLLSIGKLELLKGGKDGLSLTNLQDMSQALNVLKYFFNSPAAVIMKHLNPCGFKVRTQEESLEQLFKIARKCDERSAFGGVAGFNFEVDAPTAEAIMEEFIECVIAPSYTPEALEVLRRYEGTKKLNNAIRVGRVTNIDKIPKFVGDNTGDIFNIRTLTDGTLTLETPYLTMIRSSSDFIIDPMIPNKDPAKNNGEDYVVKTQPTKQQLSEGIVSWYLNINVRSNGVVIVKDGAAIAVGTGEQERVGAVEKALEKAIKKGHAEKLEGSVMSSDGFFPDRDSIDTAAKYGVKAIVWPAGSMKDSEIITAANEHKIALIATLERCFLHI